ncbi:MAG TPA: hypothetical protein VMW65_06895, partial [Chloroflexota bacterium]|nr:hypothetical protein [Chloroflexota bacterium]
MTARRRHRASLLLRRLRLWDRRAQRGVFPPDPLLALWERRVDAARSAGDNEAGELSEHLAAILRVLLAGRIDTVEEDARNPDAAGSSGLRSDLARLWNDLVAAQQLMGTDPTLEPELGRLTRLQASLSSAPLDPNVSEPVAIAPSPYREVSGATLFSSEIVNA